MSRYLSVALPKCVFVDDLWVIRCRLDIASGVNRARSDRVLARCGAPSERPEFPSEFARVVVDCRSQPASTIDLHLDPRDCSTPSRTSDPVLRTLVYHPAGCGIDAPSADRGFGPKTLAVMLFLANGHIVSAHEPVLETRRAQLDPLEPLYIGDAVPAR